MILEGKVAIVTGAAGSIGCVYSRGLAEAGAAIVVADLDEGEAGRAAAELEADGHRAIGVGVDITQPHMVRSMVDRTVSSFGTIDILVNNAALMRGIPHAPLAEYPLDWWERILRVNLTGALICTQAVVPFMKQGGGGKIVNQSSAGAFLPGGAYSISKLALIGLTTNLAKELGPFNINVNAIAPGMIADEAGFRAMPPGSDERTRIASQIALSGHAEGPPSDLLGALLLLTSAAGDWITGQTLSVDGGWIMRM
jgi:NAD(P)-dependent dehydrogenase (short-subunit alcohol dehydrogenase family)